MLQVLDYNTAQTNPDLFESMFELRYEVFVNRLGWKLDCEENNERDQFDHEDAVYLVLANDDNQAVACTRLLPTVKSNLLIDVFPFLVKDGRLPISRYTWESTRFTVDHRKERFASVTKGVNPTGLLYCGIFEFAYRAGLNNIVSVSDTRMERLFPRFGCRNTRLGDVYNIDGIEMVGEIFDVSLEHLGSIRKKCRVQGSVLEDNQAIEALAVGAMREVA